MHASEKEDAAALEYLHRRLFQMDAGIATVMTTQIPGQWERTHESDLDYSKAPSDSASSSQDFLETYKPHILLWAGGRLKPNLLKTASRSGTRLVLVNSKARDFKPKGIRFLPDVIRRTLKLFSDFYAVNELAANQLNRMGISPNRIKLKGPLQRAAPMQVPPQNLPEKLLDAFIGRTLWLAASVSKTEATIALSAHQLVMRRDHRSLLILVPKREQDQLSIRKKAEKSGLRVACGQSDDLPDPMTQVFVSASPEDLYACYSLAPVVLLGQTLAANNAGLDPYPPATFGCALLFGPEISSHLERYKLLEECGAARMVSNVAELANAVNEITNPETSAKMAYAAWEMISKGADLTDTLIEEIIDHFDTLDRQT